MTALEDFIRARLAEDALIADAAFDPKHPGEWVWRKDSRTTVVNDGGIPVGPSLGGVDRGPHIARWHPKRVRDEVAAKRAILDEHEHHPDRFNPAAIACWICAHDRDETYYEVNGWCKTVRLLALPYASHSDYREEWRPA